MPAYVPEYAKAIGIKTPRDYAIKFGYEPSRVYSTNDDIKEIWDLYKNKSVSGTDRICLAATFDGVLVKKGDFPKVIKAFREFEGETSLKEQADVLEEMLSSDGCIAAGWNQTSVNADTWSNCGGYDEEKEECIPYNCLTMDRHWYLFDDVIEG